MRWGWVSKGGLPEGGASCELHEGCWECLHISHTVYLHCCVARRQDHPGETFGGRHPTSLPVLPCIYCPPATAMTFTSDHEHCPALFPPPFPTLPMLLQVIALVCHLVEEEQQEPHPALIAVPSSVLPNWEAELALWAPGLTVLSYKGSPDQREAVWEQQMGRRGGGAGAGAGPHVVLTTYESSKAKITYKEFLEIKKTL